VTAEPGGFCDDGCQEEHFLRATEEASSAGAAGWVFHTDAGFRLDLGRFETRLDTIEKGTLQCDDDVAGQAVIDCLAEQLTISRCIAPPLIEDNFEGDPAGGQGFQSEYSRVHLTERGGMDWENYDSKLRLAEEGTGHVLTTGGAPASQTIGNFKYNLPAGYNGTVTIEARVAVDSSSSVSVGFANQAQVELDNAGELWFEQSGDGSLRIAGNGLFGWYDGPPYSGEYRLFKIIVDLGSLDFSFWLDGSLVGDSTLASLPDLSWVAVQIDDPVPGVTRLDDLVVTRD